MAARFAAFIRRAIPVLQKAGPVFKEIGVLAGGLAAVLTSIMNLFA